MISAIAMSNLMLMIIFLGQLLSVHSEGGWAHWGEAWFSLGIKSQGAHRSNCLSIRVPAGDLVSPGDLNLQFWLTLLPSVPRKYAQLGAFPPVPPPSPRLQAAAALP